MNEDNIRIKDIFEAIKRRWQLIIVIILAATIISIIVNFFLIKPKYQAYSKVFIGKESQQDYNGNDVQMYQKLLATYAEVIKTRNLVEKACEENGINENVDYILSNLSIESSSNTQILIINYEDYDKEKAVAIAEAITEEFKNSCSELISNANVKIIENVRNPKSPISPNKKLNIAITFALSAMASIALSLLLELLDTTFKDKESLEKASGIAVIGIIPMEENE